jgi:hypothetical protein
VVQRAQPSFHLRPVKRIEKKNESVNDDLLLVAYLRGTSTAYLCRKDHAIAHKSNNLRRLEVADYQNLPTFHLFERIMLSQSRSNLTWSSLLANVNLLTKQLVSRLMNPNLGDLSNPNLNLGKFWLVGLVCSCILVTGSDLSRLLFLLALLRFRVRFLLFRGGC